MGLSNIEKNSIGYKLLTLSIGFWHKNFFYRSFIILGKENIPTNKPLIFTPNHQNALMDALALLFAVKKQLVFVARSDIFKNPAVANLLYYFKILPIYRIRDGFDTVKKNKEIILKTVDIIKSGTSMVILPEGNHSGIRKLRPLKKGFARMAFQTEEANDYNLDLQIVPVGIYYDKYENYRSSLIVNFGKPISVKSYTDEYKVNSAVAINQIKDELSRHIKPLIIDIESEHNYDLYNEIRIIYYSRMANILKLNDKDERNRIFISQKIIQLLSGFEKNDEEATSKFQKDTLHYVKLRNKLGLTNKIIEQKGKKYPSLIISLFGLLLTLPIFIYGILNNFLAYWVPLRLSKIIKDPQFQSSFKFVLSLLSFPIFYFAQALLVYSVLNSWKFVLIYLISLPVTASLSWIWRNSFINNLIGWRFKTLSSKKDRDFIKMMSLYNEIIELSNKIFNKK